MLVGIEPSPDWKGAERVALAMEAKAGSRNEVSSDPGKRVCKLSAVQKIQKIQKRQNSI